MDFFAPMSEVFLKISSCEVLAMLQLPNTGFDFGHASCSDEAYRSWWLAGVAGRLVGGHSMFLKPFFG